jgi:hypothetical protein
MVRDDLEACLQAYQFAELFLARLTAKNDDEQREALEAAQRLRDDVEPRYEAACRDPRRSTQELARLHAARSRLDEQLLVKKRS